MTKKEKDLAAALSLFKSLGITPDTETIAEVSSVDYRNNDAAVVFAHLPAYFKLGTCKKCRKTYGVNKRSVGYCSDLCRQEDWRRTTGIEWCAVSRRDVWEGDPPMMLTPTQVETMKRIAEWYLKNQTILEILPEPEPEMQEDLYTPSSEPLEELSLFSPPTSRPSSQHLSTPIEDELVDDLFGI